MASVQHFDRLRDLSFFLSGNELRVLAAARRQTQARR